MNQNYPNTGNTIEAAKVTCYTVKMLIV